MYTFDFNVISNNVRGLRTNGIKRLSLFNRFKDTVKHKGFILLQETHSDNDIEKTWNEEFGNDNQLFFSHGSSNARGACIGVVGNFGQEITNKITDNNGRLIILEAKINDCKFIIVNIYNENTEAEQVILWDSLFQHLENLHVSNETNLIIGGDFNLFFDDKLEAKGGNPNMKRISISHFFKLKENFDLIDIWRIRNPTKRRYTFRQNHRSGFLQRRLDYLFISNHLQTLAKNVDIIPAVMSDHSPISVGFKPINIEAHRGPNHWKYNTSLNKNSDFVAQMSNLILEKLSEHSNIEDKQIVWELLKYEIRKFAMQFSKNLSKQKKQAQMLLELKLKQLEESDTILSSNNEYLQTKLELENILNTKTEGIRIRAKCNEYEHNERSTKYFLNLEKRNGKLSAITVLTSPNDADILEHDKIMNEILDFYSNLFKDKCNPTSESCKQFLDNLPIKVLNDEQKSLCSENITIEELHESLSDMCDNKSPGNDGIPPEFYKKFWDIIKQPFYASIVQAQISGQLSASQRQAIIRLIEKKDKDKKLIKNWRPISLLNTDFKIVSRALAKRLKSVLPSLISSNQTAYVKDRFIGEGARLISDILDVTDSLNIGGYMVTIDFEKAFDSLNHTFLFETLKKMQFPDFFLDWIKILLNKQESCVINSGSTTKYFPLESGARQGDPISAYLFIIALEPLFLSIEKNASIKPMSILNNKFLYTAYADDATFFLQDYHSITCLVNELKDFSRYSGLRPNYSKCEICAIGSLKGVSRALCGFKAIDLTNDSTKILGLHFTYNKKIHEERNFIEIVRKMEKILQIWRQRSLTLHGKITVFKTLVVSKLVFCSYLTDVPKSIIETVKTIQKSFIWSDKPAKIKNLTMCNSYERGGLQMTDIDFKIDALHLSWVKRLFDENDHQWKYIPKALLPNFVNGIFFPSFSPKPFSNALPKFYKNILNKWAKCSTMPNCKESIYTQPLWNNAHFKIAGLTFEWPDFSSKGIQFLHQLINADNRFKSWTTFQAEFELSSNHYFKYIQLIDSIPHFFREFVYSNEESFQPVANRRCGFWHNSRFIPINKLISREIYWILIRNRNHEPTAKKNIYQKLSIFHKLYLVKYLHASEKKHTRLLFKGLSVQNTQ